MSPDGRTHVDHTGFYRGMLLLVVVAVPSFGFAAWDLVYDSFAVRLVFAGAALAAWAGSYRWDRLRRWLWLVMLGLCHALFVWFMVLAVVHGMSLEDILGNLPVVCGAAISVRRGRELAAFMAFMIVVLVIAYRFVAAPAVDITVAIAVFEVFAAGLGWMSVWRCRLEAQLQVANATLEARVAERTASLEREVAERVAAERRASAASEAKSRFLANMSHELRTPLNAVVGYTGLVGDELAGTDQAHLCRDLDRVGRAASHLLAIIDNILDLSRVEAGAVALRRAPVAVEAAVAAAAELVQPAIAAKRDRLVVAVEPGLAIVGDGDALVRVLVHLLDNAAKFTADGTITVAAARAEDRVELAVRDTGAGIPAEARAHIFDRFTQADDSSTRLFGGAGLGLAICRELVTRMTGTIAVDSAVGRGSVFTVRLPAA